MSGATTSEKIPVHVYGGPTTLIEYGGLRFVTDPTFDPPGEYPMPLPGDHKLVKTDPSPVTAADLGGIDAVLLSHDTHDDNLDHAGRAFLSEVPVVFTSESGAGRLGGNAHGLAFWETAELWPAHCDSWAHFKEGRNEIEAAFTEAGLADRLDFAR